MDGCVLQIFLEKCTYLEFQKLSCDDSGCDGARTMNQYWKLSFGDWPDDQNSLLKLGDINT